MNWQERINNYVKETGFPSAMFLEEGLVFLDDIPPDRLFSVEQIRNQLVYHLDQGLHIAADNRVVGMWIMGNDYRVQSSYYGGFPTGYLRRIKALFPDKKNVLHLFSGNVDTSIIPGKTVDILATLHPDYLDDAQTMYNVPLETFDLVMSDPPYSVEDAEHYQTPMVKRNVVMRNLGERLTPGTM